MGSTFNVVDKNLITNRDEDKYHDHILNEASHWEKMLKAIEIMKKYLLLVIDWYTLHLGSKYSYVKLIFEGLEANRQWHNNNLKFHFHSFWNRSKSL